MIQYPICECVEKYGLSRGDVRITLPENHARLSEPVIEEAAMECMECGALLKPPYTLYRDGQIVTTLARYTR